VTQLSRLLNYNEVCRSLAALTTMIMFEKSQPVMTVREIVQALYMTQTYGLG